LLKRRFFAFKRWFPDNVNAVHLADIFNKTV